ncbi:uncharacterized protein [Amphiura filiformis]|uniref:uncharacterized protein n=1 Tax=Amphiura filiformis TaxID=82378 RepID=UPI003B20C2B5
MANGGVTHVRHNRMTLTSAPTSAQGLTAGLTYRTDGNTGNIISTDQIVALVDISRSCRQELQLDCQNVFIYNGDIASTYWYDRNGVSRGNWGTETNVEGCQCRVDGDCADGQARCNCDAEGTGVRTDRGYITDHNHLPITALFIDEVDQAGESASYRVSSLQCSGSVSNLYPSCAALQEAGLLTQDGEYLIDPDGIDTGEDPIIVRCDASTGNTVVVHSKPGQIIVPEGPGTPGYYVIDPTYANNLTPEELALLVESSEECWQWLSLTCRSARIFDDNGVPITWWIANDDSEHFNWGAPEGVTGCACSQEFEISLHNQDQLPILTAEQSSTSTSTRTADKAIDGSTSTCQETQNAGALRWWAIDLEQEFCISHVEITNTATGNQRLTGAYVTVGNSESYATNPWCRDPLASTEVNAPSGVVPVYCEQTRCGRYLAVILPDNVLSMCEVDIFGFQTFPHTAIDLEDLDTSQSSVKFDGTSNLATDGNDNPDFDDGDSCIVTDAEPGVAQWWALDFGKYQCVSRIVIKNRLDCCSNQLAGAVVRVGSDEAYGNNDQCGVAVTTEQAQAGAEVVILCAQPVCGVYLSVHQAPGGYLTFCEVFAYEPIPYDEALPLAGLPVDQSTANSDDIEANAARAIDGDDNPNWGGGTCSHTEPDQNGEQWWAVDLGENTNKCITRVIIRNRADCCSDRIAGAQVRVGNSDTYGENALCDVVEDEQATAGADITVTCVNPRCGRYISIHQDEGERILTLCEVWAFSTLLQPTLGACEVGDECSCDANDAVQRQDAGFVRDQDALPIQQVRIGDVVDHDVDTAIVDIGELVCEGKDVPALRSCQELFAAGLSTADAMRLILMVHKGLTHSLCTAI